MKSRNLNSIIAETPNAFSKTHRLARALKKAVLVALVMSALLTIGSGLHAQIKGCSDPCNLIKNGNFSEGNTSFSSGLPYKGNACSAGHYFVGTKFSDECSMWPSTGDHTTGGGNFLMVDGSNTANSVDVWKKALSNTCSQTYTFSFWAKNVYGASGAFDLGIIINGTQVSSVSINTTGWTQYSVTWSGTPISVALRQLTAGEKRDFGIDDIFFGFCPCACNPQ